MCDNKRAWLFNLLMAATILIQHVAHVAHATDNFRPPKNVGGFASSSVSLIKRDTSAANARMTSGDAPLDSEVDYAVYMNDFNMQDEATIPEDILDQQHIRDDTLGGGGDGAVGVGDIIESEDPQYDGDADQDVADIILESHRSTPINSSSSHNELGNNLPSNKNENPNQHFEKDEKSSSLNRGNFIYNNNNNAHNNDMDEKHMHDRSTQAIVGQKFQGHASVSKTTKQMGSPLAEGKLNEVAGVSAENTMNVASIDVKSTGPGRNDNDDVADEPTAIGDIEDVQRNDDDHTQPKQQNVQLNADLVLKRNVLHDRIDGAENNQNDHDDVDDHDGDDERPQQSKKPKRYEDTLLAAWTRPSKFGEIRYSNASESATKAENQTATLSGNAMTYVQQQQHETDKPMRAMDKVENQQWSAKAEGHRQSAFELFKAERRNSPHNGHKNHKKKYKDYLKFVQETNKSSAEPNKLQTEPVRRLPASPFFAVPKRLATPKPFYEGQINYFLETNDDDGDTAENGKSNSRNWYRGVSPALRNGIKSGRPTDDHEHHHQHLHHHQHDNQNAKPLSHHHHQHHYHHQEPHRRRLAPRQHHQHNHHVHSKQQQQHRQSSGNPYQRKPLQNIKQPALSTQSSSPMAYYDGTKEHDTTQSPPSPPPEHAHAHDGAMHELGHQITEMEELERYYAKWPHLARVQFQVYDEHYREAHPELYDNDDGGASEEYDEYESTAELEEAQRNNEEANLPPYIKKYNRRNKQLLNLLEGTIEPPTLPPHYRVWSKSLLQPGPHESSTTGSGTSQIRLDDDYMKEKRRRYHMRYGYNNNNENFKHLQEDLFAQQRNDGSLPQTTKAPLTEYPISDQSGPIQTDGNHLPDEDVSISMTHDDAADDVWHTEINSKSRTSQMAWPMQKSLLTTQGPPSAATPKSAMFKLPSYPAIAGNFMGKVRSRSSVQLPSSNGQLRHPAESRPSTAAPSTAMPQHARARPPINGRSINAFVYHRVEDTSPRLVGTGSTGHKQRLPFVAITDRRLEMSKKALLERQKELEQNHFPMP